MHVKPITQVCASEAKFRLNKYLVNSPTINTLRQLPVSTALHILSPCMSFVKVSSLSYINVDLFKNPEFPFFEAHMFSLKNQLTCT